MERSALFSGPKMLPFSLRTPSLRHVSEAALVPTTRGPTCRSPTRGLRMARALAPFLRRLYLPAGVGADQRGGGSRSGASVIGPAPRASPLQLGPGPGWRLWGDAGPPTPPLAAAAQDPPCSPRAAAGSPAPPASGGSTCLVRNRRNSGRTCTSLNS